MEDLISMKGKALKETYPAKKMAVYVLRGYSAENAYRKSVEHITRGKHKPSFDAVSHSALQEIKEYENRKEKRLDYDLASTFKIGKAYGRLGQEKDAKRIGIGMLRMEDFDRASKVFSSAGLKKEQMVDFFEKSIIAGTNKYDKMERIDLRNYYLSKITEKTKARREKYLDRRRKKVFTGEYLDEIKPLIEKRRDAWKRMTGAEDKFSKLEEKRKEYLELKATRIDDPEFEEKMKEYQKLGKQVGNGERYAAKLDKLRKDISDAQFEYLDFDSRIADKKLKYRNKNREMKMGYKERLQKDMGKLGYSVDLFPAWKKKLEKGELDLQDRKDRKYLKEEAKKYLEKGKTENAIEIYQLLGKDRKVNKLEKYLVKTDGNGKEASKKYLEKKRKVKNTLLAAGISLPIVIGAGIGSFMPYKVTKERYVQKYKTEERIVGRKEVGKYFMADDVLWRKVKGMNPNFSDKQIADKVNEIVDMNKQKFPHLTTDNRAVVNGQVVNHSDGIRGDVVKGREKLLYETEFVPVKKPIRMKTGSEPQKYEEKGKWPNKKGSFLGGLIGAALSLVGLEEVYRRKREKERGE